MPEKNDKYELLTDYLKGRLSGDDKKRFENLLGEDSELRRTADYVADLMRESDDIEWDKFKDPAHSVFRSLLKDYKSAQKKEDSKQGIIFFDSGNMPLPEGVRPATVNTRRLKYRIGADILEISLHPVSPASYELIGHLSGQKPGRILEIEFISGKSIKKVKSNKFQLFRLARIESGSYKIKISDGEEVIAKIDIEL
ncbi:MAG: hypothetical protein GF310_12520 [candidate division Zixibacteria bacterium]|nr:hypothetical protein [candidate division Zixibacteria bacterium]